MLYSLDEYETFVSAQDLMKLVLFVCWKNTVGLHRWSGTSLSCHILGGQDTTYLSLKITFFFICSGNVSYMEREVADVNLQFLTLEEKLTKSSVSIFSSRVSSESYACSLTLSLRNFQSSQTNIL